MSIISPSNIAGIDVPNQLAATDRRLALITYIASNELSFYKNNPRKHPEKQIVKLMASIREFGIALPILVDVNHVIIAGAAVVEAARRLEIPELPVIVAEHWSNQQVQAYHVASNKLPLLAKWDKDLLAIEIAAIIDFEEVPLEILGWENDQLDMILTGEMPDPATDPADVIPEASGPTVSCTGDLWQLGEHRLLCGSVLDPSAWTELMDGKLAAMAFTSLRYNNLAAMCPITEPSLGTSPTDSPCNAFRQFLIGAIAQIAANLEGGAFLISALTGPHLLRVWLHSKRMVSWSSTYAFGLRMSKRRALLMARSMSWY